MLSKNVAASTLSNLLSNDEVVDSIFVNLKSVEDVYEFSDVVESDEEINPKSSYLF